MIGYNLVNANEDCRDISITPALCMSHSYNYFQIRCVGVILWLIKRTKSLYAVPPCSKIRVNRYCCYL